MIHLLVILLWCVSVFTQTCHPPATRDSVPTSPILKNPPQTLRKTSELVPEYQMGPKLDDNPRTKCPHLQPGLVNWHTPSIWPGGKVPAAGSSVTLPANRKVLVSDCSWPSEGYEKITVPASSALIFNDVEMTLRVRNIAVYGNFSLGAPTCRLFSRINFNFYGANTGRDDIAPKMGNKGLACMDSCYLDIHGKQYHPTWTRVSAPVTKGQSLLYLQDPVNWEVGQSIVVATGVFRDLEDSTAQNEVRIIQAISPDKRVIQVNTPFTFEHWAGEEYQPEVGLLSRRIKFRGNPVGNFGGHILISGKGRVSGTQLIRMGQTNLIGRYPLHFHFADSCPTCYFADNSVVHSNFRCFVVHGTNNTRFLRNVAYNASGSCYYIESGAEENNIFMYNLAMHVHPLGKPAAGGNQEGQKFTGDASAVVASDHAASGFYITNSYNIFIGNAASGGWSGFMFPVLSTPLMELRNNGQVPHTRPLLRFEGNTAHSEGEAWGGAGPCFYVGGRISEVEVNGNLISKYDSGRGSPSNDHQTVLNPGGPSTSLKFINNKAWLCRVALLFWGKRVEVDGLEVHDSGLAAHVFDFGSMKRLWVNSKTPSPVFAERWDFAGFRTGFQYYDTVVRIVISRSTFKNFQGNRYALETMTHGDLFKDQGIDGVNQITWINTPPSNRVLHRRTDTGSSRHTTIHDRDGSLSGFKEPAILGSVGGAPGEALSRWWQFRSDCSADRVKDWGMWVCKKGNENVEIAGLNYLVPGLIDKGAFDPKGTHVATVTYWGVNDNIVRTLPITKNPGVNGLTGVGGWYFHPNSNTLPSSITVEVKRIPLYRGLILGFSYNDASKFSINLKRFDRLTPVKPAASYSEFFKSMDGLSYYYQAPHLYIKALNYFQTEEAYFAVDGLKLHSYDAFYSYVISATCPGGRCKSNYALPKIAPAVVPLYGKVETHDTIWQQPSMTRWWPLISASSSGQTFAAAHGETNTDFVGTTSVTTIAPGGLTQSGLVVVVVGVVVGVLVIATVGFFVVRKYFPNQDSSPITPLTQTSPGVLSY